MSSVRENKSLSILIITGIYLIAVAVALCTYLMLPFAFWIDLLIADIAATVFVFIFSVIFRNASVYDPYWSVQPIVIVLCYALGSKLTFATVLILISVFYWGIRLTGNWAYTFGGLNCQDWRYTKFEKETGRLYQFISFTGIHMMPTLIVYLCTLPAVFVIKNEVQANAGSIAGTVICICAATLQLVSDTQMHRYRKSGRHGLIRTGLWKYARHPNYLGEILMWWGIGIQAVSVMPQYWWLLAGALANTVMFFTVSIPLADKRQSQKPGYAEYKASTRSLLPVPKKQAT